MVRWFYELWTNKKMSPTTISHKFFRGTQLQARESIQNICLTQWSCIVSFVYFAQAMKFDLFKDLPLPETVSSWYRRSEENDQRKWPKKVLFSNSWKVLESKNQTTQGMYNQKIGSNNKELQNNGLDSSFHSAWQRKETVSVYTKKIKLKACFAYVRKRVSRRNTYTILNPEGSLLWMWTL